MVGRCFKVWKIDEVIERMENEEDGDDFNYLLERIQGMKGMEDGAFMDLDVPEHLRF